jgi:4-hydroxythreonine-4-phosphate dehydrogenase
MVGLLVQDDAFKPTIKKYEKERLVLVLFCGWIFGSGQYEKYDAVIATYHDQD